MAEPREVSLPAVGVNVAGELTGDLAVPPSARGLVVFAHGSGSSRHSSRNRWVAEQLRGSGVGTLLMDLLTPEEEQVDVRTAELRFDIPLLTRRVVGVLDWLDEQQSTSRIPSGLFGASTGAAAALGAAVHRPDTVRAVVSRGGRPDLTSERIDEVRAPTLLLVGGSDEQVLMFNRQAAEKLRCPHEVRTVPGATHLFEEPGALEEVAKATADWFERHWNRSA